MLPQDNISRFIFLENKLRKFIFTFPVFNEGLLNRNPNLENLIFQLLARLDIIKSNISLIESNILIELTDSIENNLSLIDSFFVSAVPIVSHSENTKSEVVRIITTLYQYINSKWEQLSASINYDFINSMSDSRKKFDADINAVNQLRNSVELELQNLKKTYKFDLQKYELISQTLTFSETSKKNNTEANIWRIVILLVTIVLIFICCHFISSSWIDKAVIEQIGNKSYSNTLLYYELIRNITLRAFVISIVVYILKFSVNNYNASKHNSSVNTDKANTLNAAFRIMTSLPESDSTRNTLLKDAGKHIFTRQKSGYINKETDEVSMSLLDKILSVVKK